MSNNSDTIAAISTPMGTGAIAIIRMSGPRALEIISQHIEFKEPPESHRVYLKKFFRNRKLVDLVLVTYFRAPHSYTGEDVVEISSHGGIIVPNEILGELLNSGARLAEPGEFSRRAFMSGKMDLLQVEAVADLINASSRLMNDLSLQSLQGKLSEKINSIKNKLVNLLTVLEHELDFQEEEIDFTSEEETLEQIENISCEIDNLMRSYEWGKYNREGFLVAITGPPNAGKSSLLNAILQRERALVTEIPGTTRDYIEEQLEIYGLPLRLVDTAGLREGGDQIERLGIQYSENILKQAQVVLVVLDITQKNTEFILPELDCPLITVYNKIDLKGISPDIGQHNGRDIAYVSALNRMGVEQLLKFVTKTIISHYNTEGVSLAITRERHFRALQESRAALLRARASLKMPPEILAQELREALNHLGEITGEVTSDDILNKIFSEFCVGK